MVEEFTFDCDPASNPDILVYIPDQEPHCNCGQTRIYFIICDIYYRPCNIHEITLTTELALPGFITIKGQTNDWHEITKVGTGTQTITFDPPLIGYLAISLKGNDNLFRPSAWHDCYGTMKLSPTICEDKTNQLDCENYIRCHWYNNSCHTNPPVCSEINNQLDCERYGCYWYDDSCHSSWPCIVHAHCNYEDGSPARKHIILDNRPYGGSYYNDAVTDKDTGIYSFTELPFSTYDAYLYDYPEDVQQVMVTTIEREKHVFFIYPTTPPPPTPTEFPWWLILLLIGATATYIYKKRR